MKQNQLKTTPNQTSKQMIKEKYKFQKNKEQWDKQEDKKTKRNNHCHLFALCLYL